MLKLKENEILLIKSKLSLLQGGAGANEATPDTEKGRQLNFLGISQ